MSTTIYDSPEVRPPNKTDGKVPPSLSIDITCEYAWFFEHGEDDHLSHAMVHKSELPAIHKAIGEYLSFEVEE